MTAPEASGWVRRRSLLLSEYERIALEMFSDRGFKEVTVDDIARAAGVSARTLFRYFPSKEDFLLAFPRRNVEATVERISQLHPSDRPVDAAWRLIVAGYAEPAVDLDVLTLWRRAAAEAPEVFARARGERVGALIDTLEQYFTRCWDVDPAVDPRPRLLAGKVIGVELTLVESYGRSAASGEALLAMARQVLDGER